jgi:hypothetical protein
MSARSSVVPRSILRRGSTLNQPAQATAAAAAEPVRRPTLTVAADKQSSAIRRPAVAPLQLNDGALLSPTRTGGVAQSAGQARPSLSISQTAAPQSQVQKIDSPMPLLTLPISSPLAPSALHAAGYAALSRSEMQTHPSDSPSVLPPPILPDRSPSSSPTNPYRDFAVIAHLPNSNSNSDSLPVRSIGKKIAQEPVAAAAVGL